MIHIGPYKLKSRAVLAPMAGITDLPFRNLCKHFGAGSVTTEMSSSNPLLRDSLKSKIRRVEAREGEPRIVQIVGTEARDMADAAAFHIDHGAQIIDINMGCPAKKVCRKLAGSALLKDERKVADILSAVVQRVNAPVTLKIRTGWDTQQRNAVGIAEIAEQCGIAALAIHGRTRACRFMGAAEYDTIATVVQRCKLPVLANGDICSAKSAKFVLDYTGAAGVMIGRGAQGKPWIFQEINDLLGAIDTPQKIDHKTSHFLVDVVKLHLRKIHSYYAPFGRDLGVKIARKHMGWYFEQLLVGINSTEPATARPRVPIKEQKKSIGRSAKQHFNRLDNEHAQLAYVDKIFGER